MTKLSRCDRRRYAAGVWPCDTQHHDTHNRGIQLTFQHTCAHPHTCCGMLDCVCFHCTQVWDVRRMERDVAFASRLTYAGQSGRITSVAGVLDGSSVASGSASGSLHVWRVEYSSRSGSTAPDKYTGASSKPLSMLLLLLQLCVRLCVCIYICVKCGQQGQNGQHWCPSLVRTHMTAAATATISPPPSLTLTIPGVIPPPPLLPACRSDSAAPAITWRGRPAACTAMGWPSCTAALLQSARRCALY